MSNSKLTPFTQAAVTDPTRLVRDLNVMQNALEAQAPWRTRSIRFENIQGAAIDATVQPGVTFQPPFPIDDIMIGRVQRIKGTDVLTTAVFPDWAIQTNGLVTVRFVGLPASSSSTWSISLYLVERPSNLGGSSQVRAGVGSGSGGGGGGGG